MENNKAFKNWLSDFNQEQPLLIAGPCSAETEDQVLKIAHQLKDSGTSVLRAGIWKPRTRPGNFEGVGAIGLKWLQKAKAETGLKTTTEVATPHHVELALEHDVDILWIGARTTVNPFIVQDLANALKGTGKTVLVKNPVNPDLSLWIGAVERFYKAGIIDLGVIHRGFSIYEKSKYRNNPQWQIPIDLQNRFPDLPLILDPSHIAGRRDLIADLCQTGLDLNYDGFMVESHIDPDNAWSDAAQQVTPETLIQIYNHLKIRKTTDSASEYNSSLHLLRSHIDVIDQKIIELMGKRMKTAEEIGLLKQKHNVAVLQSKRWNEILGKMILEGKQEDLSEEFTISLFKAIHQESIQHQKNIFKK
ncbi:MAG: bifunctional 3-deoxy-7-phosphoheptulonate synthase/chorismate mutase type II [Saprospiraceae bacterium]|nr:bifunctional 3-deoxy-7-phosphoheptulonate synthase/chorismate mutase type II [Saprospiraceae bacterium]